MTQHLFLNPQNRDELMATLAPEKRVAILERVMPGSNVTGMTLEAALAKHKADFQVETEPVFVIRGGQVVQVPGKVATYNGATKGIFGVVSDTYGVVQTLDAFAAPRQLIESGRMELQSLEVKNDGARIRMTGLFGASAFPQLGLDTADILAHYGVIECDHAGMSAIRASLHSIRLRCLNGATSIEIAGRISVRHTVNAEERMHEASKLIFGLEEQAQAEAALLADLAVTPMSLPEFAGFANELLPEEEEATERMRENRKKQIDDLIGLFQTGEGNVGRTLYDGFNSVTEWLTPRREQYEKAKRGQERAFAGAFDSAYSGHSARIRTRALNLLRR